MKTLKIEPFSGISGDMMLAALAGLTPHYRQLISNLPQQLALSGVVVHLDEVKKCGIACLKLNIEDQSKPHFRHLDEIEAIIDRSTLKESVKLLSKNVFQILGRAEAEVHQISIDQVHFHEVGAVDTIIDIVGCALLLDDQQFDMVISAPVCVGKGMVRAAHGLLPIPAPATALMLRGMPTYAGDCTGELTTPTGAALLQALNPKFTDPVIFTQTSAYGAGTRELSQPNCLRLSVGTTSTDVSAGNPVALLTQIYVIQTNIDDMSGQHLGDLLQDRLLMAGALDFSLTAIQMKKARPAIKLEILCQKPHLEQLINIIFTHTSTIGLRYFEATKMGLPRTFEVIATAWGPINFKIVTLPDGKLRSFPEYEDCKRAATTHNMSLFELYQELAAIGQKAIGVEAALAKN